MKVYVGMGVNKETPKKENKEIKKIQKELETVKAELEKVTADRK